MAYSCSALVMVLSHLLIGALCQSSMCPNSTKDNIYIDIFNHALLNEAAIVDTLHPAPLIDGMEKSLPAYDFSGLGTGFSLSGLSDTIREASCAHSEVTFTGRVFIQDSQSDGPLLELSYGAGLESGLIVYVLIIDAAADEVILGYRHRGRLHSENLPIRLIGGRWRNYAVTLSGNLLTFYFDCALVAQRVVPLPDYCANDSSIVLSVAGSMNGGVEYTGRTGLYVFMQKVGIHFGPGGVKTQCPDTPTLCPSCGQFLSLLEQLTFAQEEIGRLQGIIDEEGFSCPTTPPSDSDTDCILEDGNERRFIPNRQFLFIPPSTVCYCDNANEQCVDIDEIIVQPTTPPACVGGTVSTNPGQADITVTPPTGPLMCLVRQLAMKIPVGSAVSDFREEEGTCDVYECELTDLGPLSDRTNHECDLSLYTNCSVNFTHIQKEVSTCCGLCTACDFHSCPENNKCILEDAPSSGEASCVCQKGYYRDANDSCVDSNECTLGRGPLGHNCPGSSNCINTVGSFFCRCFSGYTQEVDSQGVTTCEDINECSDGTHNCSTNVSTCRNKPGSFSCDCEDGYTPTQGGVCEPVCDVPCENGGLCVCPNTCDCPPEFTGHNCGRDVNECKPPNRNTCGDDKICINTIGGHFCRCLPGYQEKDSECRDVNECRTRIHNCIGSARCFNTPGSFACLCNDAGGLRNCTGACMMKKQRYKDGESFEDPRDSCRNCTCLSGETTCRRVACDCSQPADKISNCCPQCRTRDCHIMKGTISIRPGNTWVNPANRCERYDCPQNLMAVFVNLSTSCPQLDCPEDLQSTPMGKCCPICMMPACDSSLEGRRVTLRNGCKQCTCESLNWSCVDKKSCPEVNCAPTDIVFYRDGCCPVCRNQVLGTENTQCFTSL